MELNTLECRWSGCRATFHRELPMWHLIRAAEEAGWVVLANQAAFCPEHNTLTSPQSSTNWVVGCDVCSWEGEYPTEREAQRACWLHECEPETWILSPEEVAQAEVTRTEWDETRTQAVQADEEQAVRAFAEVTLRQRQIEKDARNWLRLRNTVLFWKKRSY